MTPRLKERYLSEIKPELIKRFDYKSAMQAPRLDKITLNMGVGDAKLDSKLLDSAAEQLATITGQKPAIRRARKSIANFKLREGMPVGAKVTLRGDRMWEMLDRLESIAIPRIRDFRGLNPRSFDGRGNYSIGIREQIIFPEVDYDAVDQVRGLDVTITTTAASDEEAFELLRMLGLPFRRDDGDQPSRDTGAATAPAAPEADRNGSAPESRAEPDEAVPAATSAEEPVAEEAAPEEPVAAEPAAAEEAPAEQSAAEEPAAEEPAAEESAGAAAEPAAEQSDQPEQEPSGDTDTET